LTAEKYREVLGDQKKELYSARQDQQSELKSAYDRATDAARQSARQELESKRAHEQARINGIKEAIARDNENKKQQKLNRNSEMNSTLGSISQRKQEDWSRKVHDTSNKEQSIQLQREKERLKAELKTNVVKSKQEYHHELAAQLTTQKEFEQFYKNKHRRTRGEREGFQFE
jgi:hypothetical protein